MFSSNFLNKLGSGFIRLSLFEVSFGLGMLKGGSFVDGIKGYNVDVLVLGGGMGGM